MSSKDREEQFIDPADVGTLVITSDKETDDMITELLDASPGIPLPDMILGAIVHLNSYYGFMYSVAIEDDMGGEPVYFVYNTQSASAAHRCARDAMSRIDWKGKPEARVTVHRVAMPDFQLKRNVYMYAGDLTKAGLIDKDNENKEDE